MHHRPQDGQPQPCQLLAKPLPLDVTEPQRADLLQEHRFRHGAVDRRTTQAGQQTRQGGLQSGPTTRRDPLPIPGGVSRLPPRHITWRPVPSDGLASHTIHPLPDDTAKRAMGLHCQQTDALLDFLTVVYGCGAAPPLCHDERCGNACRTARPRDRSATEHE